MIKSLLTSAIILFCVFGAAAQAPNANLQSETFKQHLRSQYLQNDTIQAIINLYSKRQAGGATWIVSSALAAVRIVTTPGKQTTLGGGYVLEEEAPNPVSALLVLPFTAYGVGKLIHYSNGHLQQVVTAYAEGHPLPHSVRRKLKRRFFNQPIIQYKSLDYKPAN